MNKLVSKVRKVANKEIEVDENEINNLYPSLRRYCYFLSQNKWDGDDLAQSAMIKAMESYYNDISQSLLKKIAYNHWIDTIRKRKKEVLEAFPESTIHNKISSHENIVNMIEFLMGRLTPKQMVIYVLKEAFCFKINELSKILNTTETAVKSSLHRAKKQLEKTKHEDDLQIDNSYWDEQETQWLYELVFIALYKHDPSILIQKIPLISSLTSATYTPKLVVKNTLSPLNSFTMAA